MILLSALFAALSIAAAVALSRAGHRWWGLAFACAAGWWGGTMLRHAFRLLRRAEREDRR